jgi:hypothetical protein
VIEKTYSQLMGEISGQIRLIINTQEPVELNDFIGQLVGLGNQFEKFIAENHPDMRGDAKFYVQEIRSGSTIIDILPVLIPIITQMDQMLIVEDFLRRYASRITAYFQPGGRDKGANRNDLKDVMSSVKAIARDPKASSQLDYVAFEDGRSEVRTIMKFHTPDARAALNEIEHHKNEIEHTSNADHERVLMTFTRSDINDAEIGKRSGERVKIEELSNKSLALMYASSIAEDRIKFEIRESDQNIYKKGFVVDVNVRMRDGKPVAYGVTNLHQVIDLPDED